MSAGGKPPGRPASPATSGWVLWRFRSFLLATVRHFLAHQRQRERAAKRGGGTLTLSCDLGGAEERYALPSGPR